jgi:hypothetical protein
MKNKGIRVIKIRDPGFNPSDIYYINKGIRLTKEYYINEGTGMTL